MQEREPYVLKGTSLLFCADQAVADFVAKRIPVFAGDVTKFGLYTAIGVVRNDKFVGGAVFHNFRGHDIEVSVAFDDPRWCLPQTLKNLFSYPFNQLGVRRMTSFAGRKNKVSRKLIEGVGFRLEGVARKALDGKEDAMIYGMLREECRFLKAPDNG